MQSQHQNEKHTVNKIETECIALSIHQFSYVKYSKWFSLGYIVSPAKYIDIRFTLKSEYLYQKGSSTKPLKVFHGYNGIENMFSVTNDKQFSN